MNSRVAVIVVAAGRGTRFSTDQYRQPKQYRDLGGRPVVSHALEAFLSHPAITDVLVVIHPDDTDLYDRAVAAIGPVAGEKLRQAVSGGASRQESVRNGLVAMENRNIDLILIHDAARPFISHAVIDAVLEKLTEGNRAVLPAVPVVDTLKRLDDKSGQLVTVDRTGLWAAQTPQGFDYRTILEGHEKANLAGRSDFTDDTAIAEWLGFEVILADGDPDNFKITSRSDLDRAIKRVPMTKIQNPGLAELGDVRMGTGYDVHAFEDGDGVILGGIRIAHDKRLKGHSDADVVLHAITDAILGAIGDGDIGAHFPPSDPVWKGASSDRFLEDAVRRVTELGGKTAHVDVTVVCEAPKIGPHREAMRQSIARICNLPVSRVSVKATTSERLGFTGRKEGIAALASATVRLPFTGEDFS
ncbi:bifunctional 2-C-methyl-D-erythritol 4-phosphate cytidylyltransferase/2-C-methyl-D-erythritol 2,4-cyclodiphosphate synthase [uncultured Roseibium sp.]|uniref:bifunctional 2-C-methyl-D-erythritol 4-phosphate cytidylyltransferase/2-C-methyl-D-erythritol 2,4-cyclodiphosphate synthase n=1 Tax=uncultured Roseibium sp. TaxID=1936171 RepID=UPI0032180E30